MNCIVKLAKNKGLGVFALRGFKKGWRILKMDRSDKITNEKKLSNDAWNHMNAYGYKKYYHLKPPEKFINHSCDPNAYDKNGILTAMKNIKKGEEITYDYSINGLEDWRMVCKCSSKNCRKIVTGKFSRLPEKLQKKYFPYLEDWYVKEVMNK